MMYRCANCDHEWNSLHFVVRFTVTKIRKVKTTDRNVTHVVTERIGEVIDTPFYLDYTLVDRLEQGEYAICKDKQSCNQRAFINSLKEKDT